MPYNPRPVSKGGNRGIDELFSRNAPKGLFRVVGVDTFDGSDWIQGDFQTLEEAKEVADKESGTMKMMHVYNDDGHHLHNAGTF